MDLKSLNTLIENAKKDPKFFHSLVFEPERVLGSLEYLDKQSKGNIVASNIEEIFVRLLGVQWCGNTCSSSCDNTCGGSCGHTTNIENPAGQIEKAYYSHLRGALESCGNTCSSSCDNTCGGSCGYTTNLQINPGDRISRLGQAGRGIGGALANCGNTCSSSCDNTCGGSCGYTTNRQGGFGGELVR